MASNIYRNKKLLQDAKNKRSEIKRLLNKLRKYNPTKLKKINAKEETLSAAEKLLNKRQEVIDAFKTDIEYIANESKEINYELFKKYFNFIVPSALAKKLYKTKDAKENSELVEETRNRWSNLKDEVKKMSEDEKEIEKADKILKLVEEILDFNNKQNQIKEGLKILAPNQMLSRLPISLAQLNVGNNSEKLKNEIRQFNYS